MSSTSDLVRLLVSRNQNNRYDALIQRASNGGYHDFKFDTIEGHPEYGDCICPKTQLVHDLSIFPELADIRIDVMNGVYDDVADDEDVKRMQGWLIEDHANDKFFELIGLPVPTYEDRKNHKF